MHFPGFLIKHQVTLDEIKVTLTELEHEKTGACILHLDAEDDENLFNISLRTLPESSNGVAHILEHTVLCGSKKFPAKDPFFSMCRRSLNTYMNALTGADFTCYPASTQVKQDFYNLLDVYLDAVFYPRLSHLSFLQEGHRLELTPKNKLQIKGIVYNEMKGAMASGEARLGEALMHILFPTLCYHFNSGGNPKEIPTLTWQELKTFHEKFYHPSRAIFYFYGNLPLQDHLQFLEKNVLQHFSKIPALPPLPKEKRYDKKITHSFHYPLAKSEELQNKSYVAFGWLTCSILEQQELLALNVIDLVLMGTDAAPLKMALLKSDLCKQADSSLEDEMSEVPFIMVCKGCPDTASEKLEEIIQTTLKMVVKNGLPLHLVEGAIHQLEFGRKEISTPFGLSLFFRAALLKQHGGRPEDALKIHTLFKMLREHIEKEPCYLETLIEKHFINNTHCTVISMHPDIHLEAKEQQEEETFLKKIKETLSAKQLQEIALQSKQLESYQEKQESKKVIDTLPQLSLKDVPNKGKEFPLIQEKMQNVSIFYHPCFTNEILYADLVFDLPELAQDDLSYMRLFSLFLPQMGAGDRDYQKNLDYIFQYTGGIGLDLELASQVENPNNLHPALILRGKSLYRNEGKFIPLLHDIVLRANFNDETRLLELLSQHIEELESSIQNSPLRYAIQLATGGLSTASSIRSHWYGLEYFWKIKEIEKTLKSRPSFLKEKMQEFQERTLALKGAHLVVSCDERYAKNFLKKNADSLKDISHKTFSPWKNQFSLPLNVSQGRYTSTPVGFTAFAFPALAYLHPDAPYLSVGSKIMENKILHKRIREQGGAYGSGASYSPMSAQFYFYSYRDPHLQATYAAFKEAVDMLANEEFNAQDLEEAKLEIIQDLDAPIAPAGRAIFSYERLRSGRTPERRQAYRESLLAATAAQIQRAAREVLLPGFASGTLVSFAGKEFFEKEHSFIKELSLPLYSCSEQIGV